MPRSRHIILLSFCELYNSLVPLTYAKIWIRQTLDERNASYKKTHVQATLTRPQFPYWSHLCAQRWVAAVDLPWERWGRGFCRPYSGLGCSNGKPERQWHLAWGGKGLKVMDLTESLSIEIKLGQSFMRTDMINSHIEFSPLLFDVR